ncbi:hypothetical protein PVK06_026191 [Gossypium arboreum]|uniref:Uncharacterized protein n=1 Tax=Gossypium arboreum TaxID=29729 RepID=A0ABR0NX39_GOSAR|nr:hypothetical protein PVK06_026191 [Gossypium arboreum]
MVDSMGPSVGEPSHQIKSAFSPVKSIRTLIKGSTKQVREYIQASWFDSYPISAASPEQFVTLEIPAEFPAEWKRAGYTHIHFGAIRLALNYHGTAGKPVVTRIALLDSRYLEYQNACIATIEATLNSSLVMVTLFPNFTMVLADLNLPTALKVQIQIAGAPQELQLLRQPYCYRPILPTSPFKPQPVTLNPSKPNYNQSAQIKPKTRLQFEPNFDPPKIQPTRSPNPSTNSPNPTKP